MSIALLALVGVILILGLVAFGVGTQGWSWGTVTAAILVLLSAVGFVYLVARVGEREQAWREQVRSLQTNIARVRDAKAVSGGRFQAIPGEKSLDALKTERERWKRAFDRSQTWRGRFWEDATFRPGPPAAGKPATFALEYELPDPEADIPLTVGTQLYLFDNAAIADGGRYLGAFRVETALKDGDRCRLTLAPALSPSPADTALWAKPYESVTAFERLPSDSWITFLRTAPAAAADGDADPDAAEPGSASIIPPLRKTDAEQLLQALEARIAEVEKHDAPVPEEEWQALIDDKTIAPGMYWATVEFTKPHTLKAKATKKADGEEQATDFEFEAGHIAEFDLRTAVDLKAEDVAEIKSIVYRRPLIDADTALRGAAIELDGATTDARGLIARRAALEKELADIRVTCDRLQAARDDAAMTLDTLRKEESELSADLDRWKQDSEAAAEVATRFDDRLKAVGQTLAEAWQTVVEWGREYDGSMALLQADLDKRAPTPR